MPKFNYIAMDGSGKETRGSVEAGTQAQAIAQIRSQGLFPTAIGVVPIRCAQHAERARPAMMGSAVGYTHPHHGGGAAEASAHERML